MGQLRTVLMWFSSSYIDKWKHRNVGFSLRGVFAFIYFIQLHMRGLLVDSLKMFEEIKWFPSWVFRVIRGTLNVKVSCLLMCSCFFLYFFLSESIRGSSHIWPTDIYGMPFDIFFLPFLFSFSLVFNTTNYSWRVLWLAKFLLMHHPLFPCILN